MTTGRPGVYVSERLLPAPITSTASANAAGACIGEFAQGPSEVTLVRSWYDFTNTFGGYNLAYPATIGVGEFFKNGGSELYVRRVLGTGAGKAAVDITDGTSPVCTVTAKEKGSAGTNLRVSTQKSRSTGTGGSTVYYYTLTVTREVGGLAGIADDVVLEQFTNVRFDSANSSDDVLQVTSSSKYITVSAVDRAKKPATTGAITTFALAGSGLDGLRASAANYTAVLDDFLYIERPLVLFAPEILNIVLYTHAAGEGGSPPAITGDGVTVQTALVSWAEQHDGFAVIDTPDGKTVDEALAHAASMGASSHAAVYYPNVYISDPLGRGASSIRLVGPAGAVAGLYLATDALRGPFKAPAGLNAGIGTAVATERKFTADQLDTLNSSQTPVNAIRNIPGSGVVVMGARTLLQDGTSNRYVSMRRSLIYIKKQLEQITQFAIFETNDERLWANLRTAVSVFLNEYRNQGGLRGTIPADAYYVKCDKENNVDSDIAQGIVNIEVGVALEYPAEFVAINLTQKTVS
ncbi:Phage tail sheath C-terminal domain containing protein [uncultured Caudovirales phage]|uniref:Phage tail sheath C-terminal domain containing protein n=1 Tax=uncultured Caudovirales phage TaxID=2100421 RepID=A0A6J7WS96_9CAUD|nr:Phage tail sheath C-terminal domain containing protein [uncultured Caudovirales phage]